MFRYLVHVINSVTHWSVSQVHVIAASEDDAISQAIKSLGMPASDPNDPVKLIPQLLGEAEKAAEPVIAEAEAAAGPVVSDAEKAAENILASLPADILDALKGRL